LLPFYLCFDSFSRHWCQGIATITQTNQKSAENPG